jgi:chemotaxis protein methyltransferase CheR
MTLGGASDPGISAVAAELCTATGLSLDEHRRPDVERRLRTVMERFSLDRPGGLLEVLRRADALDDVVEALTVGETYFFREPAQFEALAARMVPELLERRPAGHRLRVWSAGCASGEEAYSLAIALEEAGVGERSELVATDLSRAALARAKRARFRPWSFRGVSPERILRYFEEEAGLWGLQPRFPSRVRFLTHNLVKDPLPSLVHGLFELDVIFCRNVLIYLESSALPSLAERLFRTLAPGGWLVIASSDPPLAEHVPFEVIRAPGAILYRRPGEDASSGAASPASESPRRVASSQLCEAHVAPAQAAPFEPPAVACPRSAEELARTARAAGNEHGPEAGVSAALAALAEWPLSSELHLLHALFAAELGHDDDAIAALRRALYLDPDLEVAHYHLGVLLSRAQDPIGARRALRRAEALLARAPPDAPARASAKETHRRLLEATRFLLGALGSAAREPP